jgi:hypothetical protein
VLFAEFSTSVVVVQRSESGVVPTTVGTLLTMKVFLYFLRTVLTIVILPVRLFLLFGEPRA